MYDVAIVAVTVSHLPPSDDSHSHSNNDNDNDENVNKCHHDRVPRTICHYSELLLLLYDLLIHLPIRVLFASRWGTRVQ